MLKAPHPFAMTTLFLKFSLNNYLPFPGMKFSYKNNLLELRKLASDIQTFSTSYKLPQEIVYALNLCLDEVLTNIISYGLKEKSEDCPINLELIVVDNQVVATMSDPGIPFNPLKSRSSCPDIQSPLEDRNIGGLGVYFLEQYMDKIEYNRENDNNVLTLTKYIN